MGSLPQKNNLILYPCRNWSKDNNCCKGFYDALINSKYEHVKVNPLDIDSSCKGLSNTSRCVWFLYDRRTYYGSGIGK